MDASWAAPIALMGLLIFGVIMAIIVSRQQQGVPHAKGMKF